jgi:hypothetical protein
MKTLKMSIRPVAAIILLIAVSFQAIGQDTKGNKNVITEDRDVESFQGINAGSVFEIYLTQQETTSVKIETDENLMDKISVEVKSGILHLDTKKIKDPTKLKAYISSPEINSINLSGAASLSSENTIKAETLTLKTSGAARAIIHLEVENLITSASGASNLKISGKAATHNVAASGASNIKAEDLETQFSSAEASGAANIKINATEKVEQRTSGAGFISVKGNPEIEKDISRIISVDNNDSPVVVKLGNTTLEVIDGDTTQVILGNSRLTVDEKGNVKWDRNKKTKFDGHWAGFDLGVNGFVDKNFSGDLPAGYEFLSLKYEKSIDVQINFFEQNINLYNNKLGLVTGLGLRWNNYRFADNIILLRDEDKIAGKANNTRDWRKSKLTVNYLQLPLLLEYQTNNRARKNSFHVSGGFVLGWRYASHSKMLYFDSGRQKPKTRDDFHLRPFRYDVTARIGWGILNLYATYSLNTMFRNDRGPEMYPFAIGLTFLDF